MSLPDVYTPAVQCPECESTDVVVYKTLPRENDGAQTRYAQCRACGVRFKLITEPPEPIIPESGNGADA